LNRDPVGGIYFNPTDSHRLLVPLEKSVEWKFDARASIEGSAVVSGENVCFGTRNGDIICLRQDTSEVVWTFTIPGNMDFAGGIGLWNGIAYFGSYDGKVYALDAATGKPIHQPFTTSPELLPIKHAASAPSEKGIVAVNCDRKLISAWNLSTGKPAWAQAFNASRVVGQPIAHQGSLYVVTTAGDLIEIQHETGEIRNKFSTGAEVVARGRIARERYFLGTAQGKLLALDLKDGRVVWSYDCGDKIVSPPTVDSEWVIVPGAKGKLHCLSTDGTFKWSSELTDSLQPETDGIIFRNHFFVGTKKGVILAIDVWTGRPVWQFTTVGYSEKEPRGVLANAIVSKGRLFIGSEDHFFYCFTLD
jgi:outer membrane protein assembly factor BamB